MPNKKIEHPEEKTKLHPRNKHRGRYDLKELTASLPALAPFVILNKYGDESIDFFDPDAVKMLNNAILKHYYDIDFWEIPANYLCPPIPGRADYIHHIADLLAGSNYGKIPTGKKIKCLDIGVGANCVYPIIGNKEYGWSFIGSDIDPICLKAATKIVSSNRTLKDQVELRLQTNPQEIFLGVIKQGEDIDLSICNPPFHPSLAAAQSGALRKLNNLKRKKNSEAILNFGGQNRELWCEGGEKKFVKNMIRESKKFAVSCFWFSTLISKESHLQSIYEALKHAGAVEVKTIPMGQGNKKSRIIAWTFFPIERQVQWRERRWKTD